MIRSLTHAGWDTEYDPAKPLEPMHADGLESTAIAGLQTPVTGQIYLHGIIPTEPELDKLAAAFGKKFLGIKNFESGTTFVFDDRGLKVGMEYYAALKDCLLTLISVLDISIDKKQGLTLWTHYSNAELANIIPTNKELKELIDLNGDDYHASKACNKWNNTNLRAITKGKSFNLQNLKLDENTKVHVYDTTHLFAKTSLYKLGESNGISKLAHPDWDKESASEWLERDPKAYLEYAATDAIIPCIAAVKFYKYINFIIVEASNKGIIPPLENKEVKKALAKKYMTASSCSDMMAKLHFMQNGTWESYKKLFPMLAEMLPQRPLAKAKGGLNKRYDSAEPDHYDHVYSYDAKSAYPTALANIKLPTWKPVNVGYRKTTLGELSNEIDKHEGCLYNLIYALDEGCSEHDRANVFYNDKTDQGFTGRVTGDNQWFTHWEIQAQAWATPNVKVEVIQGIHWEKNPNGIYANMKPLMDFYAQSRKDYEEAKNFNMASTVKLISNGTFGKTAQQTNALNPEMVHDSLMQEYPIFPETHSQIIYSSITNTVYANFITGYIRAVIAVTCRENKALMAVTDSVLLKDEKFIESKNVKTLYNHLNKALHSITWKLEHENVKAVIFKERDYYFYECHSKEELLIKQSILSGYIPKQSLRKMKIKKIAKRGVYLSARDNYKQSIKIKAPRKDVLNKINSKHLLHTLKVWNLFKRTVNYSVEADQKLFVKKSEGRIRGLPLNFRMNELVSAKEMLIYRKVLNASSTSDKSIGSGNIRFQCDTHEELERRTMVNEACRKNGYADFLHCKTVNPEKYEELVKRCKPSPRHQSKVNKDIQDLIKIALDRGLASLRELEKVTGIGKSTLNRWCKRFKAIGSATRKQIISRLDERSLDPLAAIVEHFKRASNALIEGDEGVCCPASLIG